MLLLSKADQNFSVLTKLAQYLTIDERKPFLTLFVESQGFVSLIDLKIMTLWEDSDPRLAFFDKRIDKLKVKRGIIRSDSYKKCENIPIASKFLY